MMVAVLRVVIAAGGGWLAVTLLGGSTGLFVALAGALVIYGLPMSLRSPAACGSRRPKRRRWCRKRHKVTA